MSRAKFEASLKHLLKALVSALFKDGLAKYNLAKEGLTHQPLTCNNKSSFCTKIYSVYLGIHNSASNRSPSFHINYVQTYHYVNNDKPLNV